MSADEFRMETHSFKLRDTGIGRDLGYESDTAFLAAVEAERAAMDPELRAGLEQLEADEARKLLFGDGPGV